MALKDWNQEENNPNLILWANKKNRNNTILIIKKSKGWILSIDGQKPIKPFKTKTGAFNRAKNYMLKNKK